MLHVLKKNADGARRILILGLGASGFAAAELALRDGLDVWVADSGAGSAQQERAAILSERGATVRLDWTPAMSAPPAAQIVISPGISPDSALGQLAETADCPVLSELEWGYRHCQCPVLAVTGTNGKTTTVEMVAHCLTQAGWTAPAAGNIGIPLSQAARKSAGASCLVVEVSSYQLERVERFAPLASAFLNLSADHLDRYPTIAEYARAKSQLLQQSVDSRAVVLREDLRSNPWLTPHLAALSDRLVTFSTTDSAAGFFLDRGRIVRHSTGTGQAPTDLLSVDTLRVAGKHNIENAMAALALCEAAGLPVTQAARHLQTYVPSSHRLEIVSADHGIRVINDSKSTNPNSLARALETVGDSASPRILLIAGGLDKNLDFSSLSELLQATVRQAFLIGTARYRLARLWRGTVPCRCCQSLESAVKAALDVSRPGDTVLLSPGCASQDMFANYAERGTVFSNFARRRILE
ncbi:MAG: UDP-N-acetylmuramoyl-L-alanine--D-glutamate ligase [Verrucomicrobiota bacterium]